METIITTEFKETENLGVLVAQEVLRDDEHEKAVLITLEGELGAGKTTFLKGFARGLGIRRNIQSPTFVIMNRFPLKSERFKNFFHFDCYRIESIEEMKDLEFDDIINDNKNIVCIEWASNIKKILPKKRIDIVFKVKEIGKRSINIKKYDR